MKKSYSIKADSNQYILVESYVQEGGKADDIPPFEVLLDKKKLLLKESITADVSFSTSILAIT